MAKLKSGTRIYGSATIDANLSVGNVVATTVYGNLNNDTGTISITGNLVPTANVAYDLGTATNRFRDGWFSGTTIHIGSESLSVDPNGKWSFTSNGATVEMGKTVDFNPPSANISGNAIAGDFYFTNGVSIISTISNAVDQSNLSMKTYVDSSTSSNISTANTNMKGYVDSQITSTESNITTANTNMKGYVDNKISSTEGNITTANTNMKGYVDSRITSTEGNITTANTNMKGYVDSIDSTKANLASPTFTGTIQSPNVYVTSNLYVSGDFTVTGASTTLNTDSLVINDPMMYMGKDNTSDLVDIGIVGSFTRDSFYQHTGLVRDASDQKWKLFEAVIAEPTGTIDFGGAVYSSLKLGNLETTGNVIAGGNIKLSGQLQDASGSAGTAGQYLMTTGTGIAWGSVEPISIAEGTSNVTVSSSDINLWANGTHSAQFYNDVTYFYTNINVNGSVNLDGKFNATTDLNFYNNYFDLGTFLGSKIHYNALNDRLDFWGSQWHSANFTFAPVRVCDNDAEKLFVVTDMEHAFTGAGADGILVSMTNGGGIYMYEALTGVDGKYEAFGGELGVGTMSLHPMTLWTNNTIRATIQSENPTINIATIQDGAPTSNQLLLEGENPVYGSPVITAMTSTSAPAELKLIGSKVSIDLGSLMTNTTTKMSITADGVEYGTNPYLSQQYIVSGTTTNATETELFIVGTGNRIPVEYNTTMLYELEIVARRTDAANESASWHLKGCADNFSGTTADVGNIYEVIVARDDTSWNVDVRADDVNESINVYVTGASGKTIRWTAVVKTIEVTQ